jgi:hypothetical protein
MEISATSSSILDDLLCDIGGQASRMAASRLIPAIGY